jgi:hypothetical protein
MPEPVTITLAVVGTVALKEGVKFLYGQAGELLKLWRERRDAVKTIPLQTSEPTVMEFPGDIFEGPLDAPQIHYDHSRGGFLKARRVLKGRQVKSKRVFSRRVAHEKIVMNPLRRT